MFDLEKATAEWRRQMLAAGFKTPAPLEELENHLREDVRALVSEGKTETEAFQFAVSRLGYPGSLRTEFNKLKNPRCWPVTIGSWLYAGAMILMAVFVAAHSMSLAERSKMGLITNHLLLSAHIVTFTAGYCAAFFAGCFGIFYVCYRFFHALSQGRRRSLGRAVFLFSHLAAGLTIVGVALGMLWSGQNLGGYVRGELREMAALCGSIWLISSLVAQQTGRVSEHATMLMCIVGNVVVGLAWFAPFMWVHGTAGYWPLAVFLIINLVFLVTGLLPSSEAVES